MACFMDLLKYCLLRTDSNIPFVAIWGSLMANKCMAFYTDNSPIVDIINHQTSKHPLVTILVCDLVLASVTYIFCFKQARFQACIILVRLHFTFSGRAVQATLAQGGQTANSSSHPPSTRELVPTLKGLLNSTLSLGTHKLYQRTWATFTAFTQQFFHPENPSLPISIPSLALFISYLHAGN